MPATPTSAPTSDPGDMAGIVVHSVIEGWASSPVLVAMTVLALVLGAIRIARAAVHSRHPKDPVRRFPAADRRVIFARAGGRCEAHFLSFRCQSTTGLEADHVHPHSRGGWTSVHNGQALCKSHNRRKSARVPWDWQLARLEKRRIDYFADGHERAVTRHRPRAVASR